MALFEWYNGNPPGLYEHTKWLSIDPGDKHCGVSTWCDKHLESAEELTPSVLMYRLRASVNAGALHFVVCEKWALYAWNEASMSGNEFLTSQLIGGIKSVCAFGNVPVIGQAASVGKLTYKRSPWREWKITDWRKHGRGDHTGLVVRNSHIKDSMAHGWQYLWSRGWRPPSGF